MACLEVADIFRDHGAAWRDARAGHLSLDQLKVMSAIECCRSAALAYLSRYTHRVAISNSRLIACDERGVSFKWKDYRASQPDRYKTMTLATDEFIRRFLLHTVGYAPAAPTCCPEQEMHQPAALASHQNGRLPNW